MFLHSDILTEEVADESFKVLLDDIEVSLHSLFLARLRLLMSDVSVD
jgi:hypothetical protein